MGRSRTAPSKASQGVDVFVNCPFDDTYQPLFQAILFVVLDCGFRPRCALEIEDSSQVRIEKISRLIEVCPLGIHDISRTEPDEHNDLPRFNMPLELGLFLGAKRFGPKAQQAKRCLILDRSPYRYQQFCSDIAGQDIRSHGDDPNTLIGLLRNWFRTIQDPAGIQIPGADVILSRHQDFRDALPKLCDQFRLTKDRLIYTDLTTLIREWLRLNPW